MTAPTLAGLLAASRVFGLREAIVATLKPAFPFCQVKSHPGRLDMVDVENGTAFAPPALAVAVIGVAAAEERMSGTRDTPVEIAVYVVAKDQVVDGRSINRDEIGLALCDAVLALLERPDTRWGLTDIDPPHEPVARPIFTAVTFEKGTAYWAVTWRQVLYALGEPFMDMDTPVPSTVGAALALTGDPWLPGGLKVP